MNQDGLSPYPAPPARPDAKLAAASSTVNLEKPAFSASPASSVWQRPVGEVLPVPLLAASLRALGLVAVSCVVAVWLLPSGHPVRVPLEAGWERVFPAPSLDERSPSKNQVPRVSAPRDLRPYTPPSAPTPPPAAPPLSRGWDEVTAIPLPPQSEESPPWAQAEDEDVSAAVRVRMNEVRAALGSGWAFDEEGVLWTDGGQPGRAFRDPRDWAALFPGLGIKPERIVFVAGRGGEAIPLFVQIDRGRLKLHRPAPLSDGTGAPDFLAIDSLPEAAGPFRGGWLLADARPVWRADFSDGGLRSGAIMFAFPSGELSPLSLSLESGALGEPGAPWPPFAWRVHGADGGEVLPQPQPVRPAFDPARRADALEVVSGFLGEPRDTVQERSDLLADWMDTDARTLVGQDDPLEGWSPLRPFAVATWHTGVDMVFLADGSLWSRSGGAWSKAAQADLSGDMTIPIIAGPPTGNPVLGNVRVDNGVVGFVVAELDEKGRPLRRVFNHWRAPGEWTDFLNGPVVARTVLLEGGVRAVIRFQSLDTGMVGFVRLGVGGAMPVESTPLFHPEGASPEVVATAAPMNRVQALDRLPEDIRAGWYDPVAWPPGLRSVVAYVHEEEGGAWDSNTTALSVGSGYSWAMDGSQIAWFVDEGDYGRKVVGENIAFFRGLMDGGVVEGRIPFVVALPDGLAIAGWIPTGASVAAGAYVVGLDSGLWDTGAVLPPPEKVEWVEDDARDGVPWSRVLKAYAWPDGGMLLRIENAVGEQVDLFWDMQTGAVRRFW